MPGGSWEVAPHPRLEAGVVTSVSLESAGQAGPSLSWGLGIIGIRHGLYASVDAMGLGRETQRLPAHGAGVGGPWASHRESNFVFMKSANILTTSHPWPSSVLTCSLKSHSDALRSSSPKSQEECQASSTIHTVVLRCFLDIGLSGFSNKVGFLWSEGNREGSTLRMLRPWVAGSYEHLGLGEREKIISSRTAMGSGSQLSPLLAFIRGPAPAHSDTPSPARSSLVWHLMPHFRPLSAVTPQALPGCSLSAGSPALSPAVYLSCLHTGWALPATSPFPPVPHLL